MTPITITEEMYRQAWARQRDFKRQKIDRSISDILGEIVVASLNDAVVENLVVKTKQVPYEPLPHHECFVNKNEIYSDFDAYAFVRINMDCTKAWYLGRMSKMVFFGICETEKNICKIKISQLNNRSESDHG